MAKQTKGELDVLHLLSFVGTGKDCWTNHGSVSRSENGHVELYSGRHAQAAYKLQTRGLVTVEYRHLGDSVVLCRRGFLGYNGTKRVPQHSVRVRPVAQPTQKS